MKLKKTTRNGRFGKEIFISDSKDNGYTAYFFDFPFIVTQGQTIKDAQDKLWYAAYDIFSDLIQKSKTKI
ncbi:MAG TPA: hypothetical protein PLD95_02115 [bacterium]|nr:hypothetical protein [bacterium]